MSAPRIAVVDYGAGNLRSVAKALARSELDPVVTGDPTVVRDCDGVVLPGVGAFRDAVTSLAAAGLDEAVIGAIENERPYLGLCFGLQLLFTEGEEHGITKGFGVLDGKVKRFPDKPGLLVPHIGWNEVVFSGEHPMLERLPERDCYYFVHSYRGEPEDDGVVVGRTEYGGEFASAVATDGLFAVQFHPEKSQASGKRLLDSFAYWVKGS
jgi:glutamine amidotransferase